MVWWSYCYEIIRRRFSFLFVVLHRKVGDTFRTEWSTSCFDRKIRFESSTLDEHSMSLIPPSKNIRSNKISRLGWMCVCECVRVCVLDEVYGKHEKTIAQDFSANWQIDTEIWELFYWIAATRLSIVSVCKLVSANARYAAKSNPRDWIGACVLTWVCVNSEKQTPNCWMYNMNAK